MPRSCAGSRIGAAGIETILPAIRCDLCRQDAVTAFPVTARNGRSPGTVLIQFINPQYEFASTPI
jgi:hypothetical protein